MTSLRDVVRDLRAGKRLHLRRAIYIALYALIVIAIVLGMNAVSSSGAHEWTKYIVLAVGLVAAWFVASREIAPPSEYKDVFARDMRTAGRHERRARRQASRPLTWAWVQGKERPPAIRDAFTRLGHDSEITAASDGWTWFAAERDWHGFPDPPRFVILGFDPSGALGAAVDLDDWPKAWSKPEDWPFEPAAKA